ncbi:MAG: hypothetical protein ACFB21_00875 [Opitutales bacterium]
MAINSQTRPLILRSNRFLGSALLERELVSNDVLEAANERLLEIIQAGEAANASLLYVLLYDLKELNESALIENVVDTEKLGAIDLTNYNLANVANLELDLSLCQATFTLPFDQLEGVYMVATAYYLSRPAVQYWEQFLDKPVIWYVSSVRSIIDGLERLRSLQDGESQIATA